MSPVSEKKGFSDLELPSSILIAGVNTRPILKSAKSLGMKAIVVDCFDDIFVSRHSDSLYVLREKSDSKHGNETLFDLAFEALSDHDPEVAVLTSGLEHQPNRIREMSNQIKIAGNSHHQIGICRDTEKLFETADNLGIPHPETKRAKKLEDAKKIAEEIGFPVIIKPPQGGGGIGIKLAENEDGLENPFKKLPSSSRGDHLIIQDYIDGVNASASVISNGNRARCLTVNQQIIGDKRLGVTRDFGYCGNVIPLSCDEKKKKKIEKFSEEICESLNLVGSNGVDFVVSDKPYLIEVNPRFQGTMDLVEKSLRINLLKEHLRSLNGEILGDIPLKRCSAKLITYAKEDLKAPNLSEFTEIVDVPREGSIIERGSPICSILKSGNDRQKVVKDAYEQARVVLRECHKSSTSSHFTAPE